MLGTVCMYVYMYVYTCVYVLVTFCRSESHFTTHRHTHRKILNKRTTCSVVSGKTKKAPHTLFHTGFRKREGALGHRSDADYWREQPVEVFVCVCLFVRICECATTIY